MVKGELPLYKVSHNVFLIYPLLITSRNKRIEYRETPLSISTLIYEEKKYFEEKMNLNE